LVHHPPVRQPPETFLAERRAHHVPADPLLAGEGDDGVVPAVGAPESGETVRQDAALEMVPEGVLHVAGEAPALPGAGVGQLEEGVEVLPDDNDQEGRGDIK